MRSVALVTIVAGLLGLGGCQPPGYGHHGDPDASSGSATDGSVTTTVDAAPDGPVSGVCNDNFRLDGHGAASSVYVTGDFCMWGDPNSGGFVLAKRPDGAWTGTRAFAPGTYMYKFVVDGSMYMRDPNDPNVSDDGFGGHNSLYTCTL